MKLPETHEMTREDLIRALLRVRYPDIFYVSGKQIRAGDYNRATPLSDTEKVKVAPFLQELRTATYEELETLYERDRPAREELYKRTQEAYEKRQPFNQPHAAADYEYWAKASYWNLEEMTVLSVGKDPRRVNKGQFEMAQYSSAVAKAYIENRELITRAQEMGQLFPKTFPTIFLAWARRVGMSTPDELTKAVEKLGVQVADWKTHFDKAQQMIQDMESVIETQKSTIETQKATIHKLVEEGERVSKVGLAPEKLAMEFASSPMTKRLNTLLKIIGAMAYDKYHWTPGKTPSPAKQISGATNDVNAPVGENTIRERLNEAAELINIPETKK